MWVVEKMKISTEAKCFQFSTFNSSFRIGRLAGGGKQLWIWKWGKHYCLFGFWILGPAKGTTPVDGPRKLFWEEQYVPPARRTKLVGFVELVIFFARAREKTLVVPEGPGGGGWSSFKEALARTGGPHHCRRNVSSSVVKEFKSNRLGNNCSFATVVTGEKSDDQPSETTRISSSKGQVWEVIWGLGPKHWSPIPCYIRSRYSLEWSL